jgi:hypothetical protein
MIMLFLYTINKVLIFNEQFRQIFHKCGSIQSKYFFVDLGLGNSTTQVDISIFCIVAQQGYLEILKWAGRASAARRASINNFWFT